ncbi:unnamed protein product [Amoebophrya sp. A25]|nr:unnamed protein product [Amoebophrya sp. A25]|eukprot:GSA25T00027409001.1
MGRGRAFPRRRSCASRMAAITATAASVPGVKIAKRGQFPPGTGCIVGCLGGPGAEIKSAGAHVELEAAQKKAEFQALQDSYGELQKEVKELRVAMELAHDDFPFSGEINQDIRALQELIESMGQKGPRLDALLSTTVDALPPADDEEALKDMQEAISTWRGTLKSIKEEVEAAQIYELRESYGDLHREAAALSNAYEVLKVTDGHGVGQTSHWYQEKKKDLGKSRDEIENGALAVNVAAESPASLLGGEHKDRSNFLRVSAKQYNHLQSDIDKISAEVGDALKKAHASLEAEARKIHGQVPVSATMDADYNFLRGRLEKVRMTDESKSKLDRLIDKMGDSADVVIKVLTDVSADLRKWHEEVEAIAKVLPMIQDMKGEIDTLDSYRRAQQHNLPGGRGVSHLTALEGLEHDYRELVERAVHVNLMPEVGSPPSSPNDIKHALEELKETLYRLV